MKPLPTGISNDFVNFTRILLEVSRYSTVFRINRKFETVIIMSLFLSPMISVEVSGISIRSSYDVIISNLFMIIISKKLRTCFFLTHIFFFLYKEIPRRNLVGRRGTTSRMGAHSIRRSHILWLLFVQPGCIGGMPGLHHFLTDFSIIHHRILNRIRKLLHVLHGL